MGERKYAFLMINYELPELIKETRKLITDDDLYTDPERPDDYGIENVPHVTLAACLDNATDIRELRKKLRPISDYRAMLTNVSLFDNDLYDVLKCDVASDILTETNADIIKDFPSYSEFKEYRPHMTVAYLKKGYGDRFVREALDSIPIINPLHFVFSYWKDGVEKPIVATFG